MFLQSTITSPIFLFNLQCRNKANTVIQSNPGLTPTKFDFFLTLIVRLHKKENGSKTKNKKTKTKKTSMHENLKLKKLVTSGYEGSWLLLDSLVAYSSS